MIVVMPMAGRGSRFATAGFDMPKPLIDVLGSPMFVWALKSIQGLRYEKLVIIALREHQENYNISGKIDRFLPGLTTELVLIDEVTEGQLCTVLTASRFFSDAPLLVIASDTYVDGDIGADISAYPMADGIISVAQLPGDSWSFAKTDDTGRVIRVAEKERISGNASTGIYFFRNALRFKDTAEEMIRENKRVRGEFYIMPLYQEWIDKGKEIRISTARKMWDMGTPQSLELFVSHHGS